MKPKPFARASRGSREPYSVWEVLGEEYCCGTPSCSGESGDPEYHQALQGYRSSRKAWHDAGRPESGRAALEAAELAFRRILIARLHARKRTALCFSGGGIRSATFGLGALQGMAAHSCAADGAGGLPRFLAELDFISTVSGGGYLGSWFSAWASREAGGARAVMKELACAPDVDWEPEPEPLRHLRRFTNYLNPQLGAFSADTWTLVSTVVRNIVLNWLVILPLLAAFMALPRLLLALVQGFPPIPYGSVLSAGAVLLSAGVAYMVLDLPSAGNARLSQAKFLTFGFGPLFLAAVAFILYWAWAGDVHSEPSPGGFVLYGIGIMAAGVLLGGPFALWTRRAFDPFWIFKGVVFALVAGAVGGLFSYWMTRAFTDPVTSDLYDDVLYTWLSLPALLGVFALTQGLLVALTSTLTDDEDREWWSRSMAWIFIAMTCCFAFSGIALMAPVLGDRMPPLKWQSLATAISGFLASGLGKSPATGATRDREEAKKLRSSGFQLALQYAPRLIMPVFLLLLAGLVATFDAHASLQLAAWLRHPPSWSPFSPVAEPNGVAVELLLMALLAAPALLISRLIDANKFSLHAMYRARLIRTFLGASNTRRKPNPFTGFDESDNVRLADLGEKPLHVVNAALNLVKGENLAWQQRKAESFTMTRYRVGSCRVGYQESRHYAGNMTLGDAITLSGAAANPNMGYVSSPLLGMVMMLFNARLGAWLPNPGEGGKGCWSRSGPTYSVRPFIDEAFGLTDDKNAWVNISDGGHFENLGLYEMVLRRCAVIVVVDGSADPSFHFDDLGNAVRKIRIDMGIPIEFPAGIPIRKRITPESRHCAVGTIVYSAVDGPGIEDGTLVYIKSSLTGNEPRDVLNYAAENRSFPHQPTSDQWFDESQFESYRRLGYHVVEEILGFSPDPCSIEQFCAAVRGYSGAAKKQAAAQ